MSNPLENWAKIKDNTEVLLIAAKHRKFIPEAAEPKMMFVSELTQKEVTTMSTLPNRAAMTRDHLKVLKKICGIDPVAERKELIERYSKGFQR